MPTAVPAVERAVRVLDLLARSRESDLTLSRISDTLHISKATCLSILVCLGDAGLICRDPESKTYRIGPELVRFGWSAIGQVPGIDQARREIFALNRDHHVGCFVCTALGDEIVILDRAGVEDPTFAIPPIEATRAPLRAPDGAIYVAWSSPVEIAKWLERSEVPISASDRALHLRALTAVRARGYSMGGRLELKLQLEGILDLLQDGTDPARLEAGLQLADLIRIHGIGDSSGVTRVHPISYLIAPAFDRYGRVVLTLTVVGKPGQLTDANVDDYAKPLLSAVERITLAIGGQPLMPNIQRTLHVADLGDSLSSQV